MEDSVNTQVRVSRTGISLVAETAKMEQDKPYWIYFDGEDLVVVRTGRQLEFYEALGESVEAEG